MTASRRRLFSDAPVWVSGFRPFYLLGALLRKN